MKNHLKPLGCIYLNYQPATGIVSPREGAYSSTSKPFRLEDVRKDNKAVNRLIDVFNLQERESS